MMSLRVGTLDDCDSLAKLHAQNFARRWSSDAFHRLLTSEAVMAIIAELGGSPCGFLLFRVAADEADILTVGVAAAARRAGIGQALVSLAAELAVMRGANTMFLEVSTTNAPALRLYEKLGFQRAGQRTAYYWTDAGMEDAYTLKSGLPLASRPWEIAGNFATLQQLPAAKT